MLEIQRILDLSTYYGFTVVGVASIVGCVMQELAGAYFALSQLPKPSCMIPCLLAVNLLYKHCRDDVIGKLILCKICAD